MPVEISRFWVEVDERLESPETNFTQDGFRIGSFLGIASFILGIGPYLILLLTSYRQACLSLVFVRGYHYLLRFINIYLVNDCVVPGIALVWWTVYTIFCVVAVMIFTHLWYTSDIFPGASLLFFAFVRLLVGGFTTLHACNPRVLSGFTFFPQNRFAELEKHKRVKIALLTILVAFLGSSSHLGFVELKTRFSNADGKNQVWWFFAMRVFRWCLKPVFWYIGHTIDKLEANPAVHIAHCYLILLYSLYFVTYRQLLDEIKDIQSLIQTAALHATWEFFSFAVLVMPSMFTCIHSLGCRLPFRSGHSGKDQDLSKVYQRAVRDKSVEYGNRMFLTFATLAMSAAQRTLLIFVNEKYQKGGAFDREQLKIIEGRYRSNMEGIGIMFLFELVAYISIMWCNRYRVHGGSFRDPWLRFIKVRRHQWILVMSASHSFASTSVGFVQCH